MTSLSIDFRISVFTLYAMLYLGKETFAQVPYFIHKEVCLQQG